MLDGEKQLIESAVRGEASAFGRLYDHYQPMIYRFVLVKTSRREEAEDLTHQIFVNAWQNIGRYREMGFPFSSWLYRIARNQIVDFYRSQKRTVSIDDVDPEYFAVTGEATLAVETKLEMERALSAVRSLKADYQDVILMRFVEDLSLKEVAEALGKSEGAVKLVQHRALQKLRTILS
ncbi:MAG TPA: sigma-70 family RNA polymerase sigma factor [Candidatus Paceibacterota bacterium]|nr:sigma-70 family RNA polymerase sigma factor [Candidatus Paceibacterota bacterium]